RAVERYVREEVAGLIVSPWRTSTVVELISISMSSKMELESSYYQMRVSVIDVLRTFMDDTLVHSKSDEEYVEYMRTSSEIVVDLSKVNVMLFMLKVEDVNCMA
ncbi:hypothetical protein A2U01_0028203, partial [Trifolium medium]|nr:hypothetical protein [Trifolium medium]